MVAFDIVHPTLVLGLVRAEGVRCEPADAPLAEAMGELERGFAGGKLALAEPVRKAVRDVLRVGGYKPTGRGKPASELLAALAQSGALPRISNLVDINNLVSLEQALPISMLDLDRLGADARIRFGRAGESYVFNPSGHGMDLAGLPVICRGDEPVANAVRDSMVCKVDATTTRVLAVVYASAELPAALVTATCERLAELLTRHAGAQSVATERLPRDPAHAR